MDIRWRRRKKRRGLRLEGSVGPRKAPMTEAIESDRKMVRPERSENVLFTQKKMELTSLARAKPNAAFNSYIIRFLIIISLKTLFRTIKLNEFLIESSISLSIQFIGGHRIGKIESNKNEKSQLSLLLMRKLFIRLMQRTHSNYAFTCRSDLPRRLHLP